jgi:2-amino-4-hydroxy-6-hydroxymethyldihydropteridine diphosphokinase
VSVCYLGIGSNLGDRERSIGLAIKKINSLPGTRVIKKSRLIETVPEGGPAGQGKFLNGALKIDTKLSPLSLLKNLKAIENKLGRPSRHCRNGPRTIDLDILFYADKVINRKELKVPHPKAFEREFVLRPLMELI